MSKIEMGAGFVVVALGGFGLLNNVTANIILMAVGGILVLHGCYDLFLRPYMFWERRLKGWLLTRNWSVKTDKNPKFYFVIFAEDDSHRQITISRGKEDKGILAFTARIPVDKDLASALDKLAHSQRAQLLEDIKVFFASKNMGYGGASWPLAKLAAQGALPLDGQLSEHIVDLKAKEMTMAIIGVRSLIRKATNKLD